MINGLRITEIPLVKMQLQSHHKKLMQISKRNLPVIADHKLQQKKYQQQQSSPITSTNHSNSAIKNRSTSLPNGKHNFFALLSHQQAQRLNKHKQNHSKSYAYHKLKKDSMIEHQNNIIFQKIVRIQQREDINNPSPKKALQKQIGNSMPRMILEERLNNNNTQCDTRQRRKMAKDFIYRKKQSLAIQATNLQIGKRIMNSTTYYSHLKDLTDFTKTRQIINRLGKFQVVQKLMSKRSKTLPNKLPKINTEQSELL